MCNISSELIISFGRFVSHVLDKISSSVQLVRLLLSQMIYTGPEDVPKLSSTNKHMPPTYCMYTIRCNLTTRLHCQNSKSLHRVCYTEYPATKTTVQNDWVQGVTTKLHIHETTSVAAIRDIIHRFPSARLGNRLQQHLNLWCTVREGSVPKVVARVLIEKCCISDNA